MRWKSLLLSGAALIPPHAVASAQDPAPPADSAQQQPAHETIPEYEEEEEDPDTIVVTGARPRGSAIGDIPPEAVLNSRDVLATGATDINELLEALEPQIGSARGRGGERPILLLNGQRISSFRELRDIPAEAISRVDILPEEVALKYGYRADQKVVNIVLRERFRSTVAQLEGGAATEGSHGGGEADFTRMMIGPDGRTTADLDIEANSPLTEAERDIVLDPEQTVDDRSARTLIGSRRQYQANITHNRQIGAVSATGNLELEHIEGRSLVGLGETLLEPLARNTVRDSAHLGGVLNGNAGEWNWSVTGNADAVRGVTKTDNDATDIRDRAETKTLSADVDAMANGTLFRLPAGDAGATVKVGASTLHLDGENRRERVETSNSLSRTRGSASANVDLPMSRRNGDFAAIGNLTLNGNAELEQLSDFGTLATFGAGLNWSPAPRASFIASWTREEGAPTIEQLGDPVLETPDTRIFDFTTGQTVLVTAITGGNPLLDADSRDVFKLATNWRALEDPDLTLRAEYVRSTIDDPISSFPGPTAGLEAAFPERFVRNAAGELVGVDLRPVNYEHARRDTLRLGFDFSKRLRSAPPSQAAIEAFRSRGAASGEERGPRPDAQSASPEAQDAGGGGMRGLGRFGGGGGREGGRLTFSITDTITLVDEVLIRPGLANLDYLHGDAVGQLGGRPRHEIEARAGYFNNGLGARFSANWRSGTRVDTETGDDLRFSPLATFDLRLWANLGQRYDLVAKYPWLRGTSVRFEVDNLFDSKPKVRNAAGEIPFGYQSDLLDPLGRTVSISFRKLFLPPRGSFRREGGRSEGGEE